MFQGQDSVAAPFALLYNDVHMAAAMMSAFVERYLPNVFSAQAVNSITMHEHFIAFLSALAYHQPLVCAHLRRLHFHPNLLHCIALHVTTVSVSFFDFVQIHVHAIDLLYALSWFLSAFAHTFPMKRLMQLWDNLIASNCSSYAVLFGCSIIDALSGEAHNAC